MLKNPFGYLLYLFLRNDYSWGFLSDEEKARVLDANKNYNVTREDYANPELYGGERNIGGENWDSFCLRQDDHRGQSLKKMLEEKKPVRVLEIGPGAGYYTRLICESESVTHYTAIDIGPAFLEYLRPRLEKIKQSKTFSYDLVLGDVVEADLQGSYDCIVLLSAIHHIPNRLELFEKLNSLLLSDGVIFSFEPSHYLPRIFNLSRKCLFNGYLKRSFYSENFSTHHMCSYGEYKEITRKLPQLKIDKVFYQLPEKTKKFNWLLLPKQWFSNEIGIILKKTK